MSGGVGFSRSKSSQRQNSNSGTSFPGLFLRDFQNQFGPGVTQDQLLNGGLPTTVGLFSPDQRVGIQGTNPSPGQPQGDGQTPATPNGAQAPSGPHRFSISQVTPSVEKALGGFNNKSSTRAISGLQAGFASTGVDPNKDFTSEEFTAAVNSAHEQKLIKNNEREALLGAVTSDLQVQSELAAQQQNAPRFTNTGAQSGVDPRQGAAAIQSDVLNPINIDAERSIGFIPNAQNIAANASQAGQADIAQGDFNAFQRSLFEGQFRPVQREIERQGALEDRALSSQLAGAGLASSGTGIGQQQQQLTQRQDRLTDAATDAATQASIQSLGVKFEQELNNANNRQANNIANSGLDLDAQKANAQSILLTGQAQSNAYYQAIGLNVDSAAKAKDSFLQMLDIQETDLARQDNFALASLTGMVDTWLKTFGALANAGRASESAGKSDSLAFGAEGSASFGGMGGGG